MGLFSLFGVFLWFQVFFGLGFSKFPFIFFFLLFLWGFRCLFFSLNFLSSTVSHDVILAKFRWFSVISGFFGGILRVLSGRFVVRKTMTQPMVMLSYVPFQESCHDKCIND